MESGLYVGQLRHRRFLPRPHAFDYSLFMAFLDIDRIPELMSVQRGSEGDDSVRRPQGAPELPVHDVPAPRQVCASDRLRRAWDELLERVRHVVP